MIVETALEYARNFRARAIAETGLDMIRKPLVTTSRDALTIARHCQLQLLDQGGPRARSIHSG